MQPRWRRSRFDEDSDTDPLGSMANLIDLMLVFACGLIAALVARTDLLQQLRQQREPVAVERGRELPQLPPRLQGDGSGMESVGRVYRDPESGKLILIGE
jgi:hypothetical protein